MTKSIEVAKKDGKLVVQLVVRTIGDFEERTDLQSFPESSVNAAVMSARYHSLQWGCPIRQATE